MEIKKIKLENFRNIENEEIDFLPGINAICGDNAQGKTNILEAVYFFTAGRSFRGAKDREYLSYGKDYSRIEIDFSDEKRNDQKLEAVFTKNGKRTVKKNGVFITKMSEFIGTFRCVVFCPEHLSLVKDGPNERRKFLDYAISQLSVPYVVSLQKYRSLLQQRNALLQGDRDSIYFADTLDAIDIQMAKEGYLISKKRKEYVEILEKSANEYVKEISNGKEEIRFGYDMYSSEEDLYEKIKLSLDRDIRTGMSNTGIHKDNLEIYLNEKSARTYSSQGQQRSVAIAMKMAEAEISYRTTGEYPIMLLDDVLSELDEGRKDFLIGETYGGQVILTACETEVFKNRKMNINIVKDGKVKRCILI